MTKNLSFFAFYGPFHELLRIGLGVPGRFKMTVRPDKYLRAWTKLLIFVFYGRFHELLPIILGFQGNLHVWELWEKTCRFCVLCPFSWVIDNSFVVPGQFKMTLRSGVRPQNLMFSCFVAVFMSYCPQFWRSRGIRMGVRPDTCFRVRTKNSPFSRLRPFSWATSHIFRVPRRLTCLRIMT